MSLFQFKRYIKLWEKKRLLVRSYDRKNCISYSAADFKNSHTVIGGDIRRVVEQELGKFGEQPVAILKKLVLVNRVKFVPVLVGIRLQLV